MSTMPGTSLKKRVSAHSGTSSVPGTPTSARGQPLGESVHDVEKPGTPLKPGESPVVHVEGFGGRRPAGKHAAGGWVRTHPRTFAAIIVLLVLAAAGAGVGAYFGTRSKDDDRAGPIIPVAGGTGLCADKYRAQLPTAAQDLADAFCFAKDGAARSLAAEAWKTGSNLTYACSGITDACLATDSNSYGVDVSACTPLADGAACATGMTCSSAICVQGSGAAAAAAADAAKRAAELTAAKNAANLKLPSKVSVAPVSSWATRTITVDTTAKSTKVAPSFMALSHEWTRMEDYATNTAAFKRVFDVLGPKSIMRIGGATQDRLTASPPANVWSALVKLHKETGIRYIIGLPLHPPNCIQTARAMMQTASTVLPAGSVLGYEIGQEPEFWENGEGGYTKTLKDGTFDPASWVKGFDAYVDYFARVAAALTPCGAAPPVLGGPGWGNLNTLDKPLLNQFVGTNKCVLQEVAMHYYPYIDNTTVDARTLLSQDLLSFGMDKFRYLLGTANFASKPLRIAETNSLYGGGRAGLSETLVGAFWVADAAFELASAGAVGMHLHLGLGGDPKTGAPANTGFQTNFYPENGTAWPSIHAPFYGYILFTTATGQMTGDPAVSPATFVAASPTGDSSCGANIKAWALVDANSQLRITVLNKDTTTNCNVALQLPTASCAPYAGAPATVSQLLSGSLGMMEKGNISWAGQTWTGTLHGGLAGTKYTQQLKQGTAGGCSYSLRVPAATAALLVIDTPSKSG